VVVVGASVVVGAPVVVGTVVVLASVVVVEMDVVGGAVTKGRMVVLLTVEPPTVIEVASTLACAWGITDGDIVVMVLRFGGAVSAAGVVRVDVVLGSREPVVGAEVDLEAGSAWAAGSARVRVRRGGAGCGMRAVEATRAARTAVVSPKATRSSREGHGEVARCRGPGFRCRGGDVGMVGCPGSMSAQGLHGHC
jgi:hypothetical protein